MSVPFAIATNVYQMKKNVQEHLVEEETDNCNNIYIIHSNITFTMFIWTVFNLAISMFAIYLAFKCIKKGKNKFLHLFSATFFSAAYIPYYYGMATCK